MIWLKLRREIAGTRWQFLAVALIVTLGIGMFSSSYMSYRNLKGSYDYSYEQLNFADYWISLPGLLPAAEAAEALQVEGVQEAEARLVVSLPAEVNSSTGKKAFVFGMDLSFIEKYLPRKDRGPVEREPRKLEVRVLSVPDEGRPQVNDLLVIRGDYAGAADEIMVESRLADFHELRVGDRVTLFSPDGRTKAFRIAGVVRSPEFIWVARNRQDVFPSPDVFGVAFMQESAFREFLFDGGPLAVNEAAFRVSNATTGPAIAERVLDALPEGASVITRDEQLSNELLKMDLDGYRQLAVFFPALFLVVGALTLYVLMARTVHAQRRLIGTMRALGYSSGTIMIHYLAYGILAGLLGAAAGVAFGLFLSSRVTELYVSLIGLPLTRLVPQYGVVTTGVLLGLLTAALGGIIPARAAASLMPAEAMRERPPAAGRKTWVERIVPFLGRLPGVFKVGFRDLFRNPRRSLYTIFGVAVATSLILVSSILIDSSDWALRRQFEEIERYDVRASFFPGITPESVRRFVGKDGVKQAEGIVELPVEVRFSNQVYTTVLRGLEPGEHLLDLRAAGVGDADLEATSGAGGLKGIFLSSALKGRFKVSQGDSVAVKSLLTGTTRELEVMGFADMPLGAMAYGEREAVIRLFDLPDLYNTLLFSVNGDRDALIERLHSTSGVMSLLDQAALRQAMRQMLKLFYAFIGVMLAFGGLMALAILFNTTLVNILERERELATMRTLGVTNRTITLMVTLQNMMLGAVGLMLGGVMGYILSVAAMRMWSSDLFTFAVVGYPRTYIATGVTIVIVLLLSQIPALRHVGRLELSEVVKQFEG